MPILTPLQLQRVHGIVETDLAGSRTALLAGIDRVFVARMPSHLPTVSDQLLSDLNTMNELEQSGEEKAPLMIWLQNAIALLGPRRGALEAILKEVEADSPLRQLWQDISSRNRERLYDQLCTLFRGQIEEIALRLALPHREMPGSGAPTVEVAKWLVAYLEEKGRLEELGPMIERVRARSDSDANLESRSDAKPEGRSDASGSTLSRWRASALVLIGVVVGAVLMWLAMKYPGR